ncbi:MAG: hypothetical protein M3Z25_16835 [Actinomycetota bacterium]|nr:hypothetical protein [Actinomycetota bacterium]
MAEPDQAESFEWDDDQLDRGNTAHLAESRPDRPSIAWWEVEEVFANGGGRFVPNKRGRAGDWLLVGETDGGRMLTVVVRYDSARRMLRAITGWECTAGERARYL